MNRLLRHSMNFIIFLLLSCLGGSGSGCCCSSSSSSISIFFLFAASLCMPLITTVTACKCTQLSL
ncbi:hypothetical protein AAHE18_18G084600 [Arachis hypogaea]